ncbi:hypothetical protein E3N88_05102 [Mikania micrantha]|uniref:Uncharacterized protein n=1 Tax=Mikania micrantha TaxID=192012 RepID=A0A5N6PWB8_9ASTR|nr:hypothetical protein E3N88_05102 [Mikania micrantha]
MSFWGGSFFNYSVPNLNEEPPVEYSYGTIDLNAEPNTDVSFDSQASYGFVYDDSKQSNPEEGNEEKPAASNVNWETKEEFMSKEALVGWVESRALDNGYIVVKRRTKKSKKQAIHSVEEDLVENLTERHMDPRNILSSVKKHNPANVSVPRDVYNLQQKIKNNKKFGDTPMQERGTLWGGAFVTHIARSRGMVDMVDDLPAIEPRKLDRRTIISMKLAADIPGLGLRYYRYSVIGFTTVQTWRYKIKSYSIMLACMGNDILELGFPDVILDVTRHRRMKPFGQLVNGHSTDGAQSTPNLHVIESQGNNQNGTQTPFT